MVFAGVDPPERLTVLCGPTAVGKTALAVALAGTVDAEIICADSRTVYRGMDIGTAKPTAAQRARVPHHLLDVADPDQLFTLADFQRLARAAIAAVRGRGRLPLVVGGTGLYIRAIVDDLTIPEVPPDPHLRAHLQAEESARGPGHLHVRLAALDPVAASRIHPRNIRRLIRALEVTTVAARPISALQRTGPPLTAAMIGLSMERDVLYRGTDARVDAQVVGGLVDEVRGLLAQGIPADVPAMQGLGYKEIVGWLRGGYPFEEAVRVLKRNTRRYAKRQLTWFRRDPRVRWIDVTPLDEETLMQRVRAMMDADSPAPERAQPGRE
ncbi:MAG: tRNA (adenosine(37)-N6)-dimethylallyltransferase MiaA [Armatimonadota bacterium]